ncbi:beta-aspartyl-dipeptidase (metallo-type) [Ruminiclostridium sufflavum DSM 19573]|uniref:Isoaspartyl dipeptidase n=1 Tax=Ruminiclostridium sufflavum DSM 19573 TaxID=1121337 RepID=A0A318XJ50_9FIRM|nr:beta-aspartyl-peptidase [Ruminiclostridium sufflavum]PYG87265.1 beta-aspartyl-dipeptidase (metallo-type) [Ruminiclostridium sufflavum DSM 19573]
MFTLLKDATVYSPEYLGKKDILFCFDRIALIEESINASNFKAVNIVDCRDRIIFPGFIDLHVHIAGGGGEGGYTTRTLSANATDILKSGITTVAGILGADGVTRNIAGLYAQAKQLEGQGLTTYIYTGSYQVPPVTLTGSVQSDMVFIDKVIGVGEICLADSRSFEPAFSEISRLAAQTRNGAMLSGKAGLVHFHMGAADNGLDYLFRLIRETMIPKTHFLPTHVNRTHKLFNQAVEYLKEGGLIDLTAGFIPNEADKDCIASYTAIKQLIDLGIDTGRVTMSSDAYGSVPVFDEKGNVISSDTVSTKILFDEIRAAIKDLGVPIEKAISIITKNPAGVLKLYNRKGSLEAGKDADCVICDKDLNIIKVFAMGKAY